MFFPALTWLLLILSAAFCAVGFYKFKFFTTLGHGLAVAGLGLCCLIIALSGGKSSPVFFISCLLCLVYGLFQGVLTGLAELLGSGRRKKLKSQAESVTPWYVQGGFWLLFSLLYVLQISPLWYRTADKVGKDRIVSWIALVLMAVGLLIIILAHIQAAGQKRERPDLPPMQGIYTWARCPMQLGRIIFWLGMLLSGVSYVSGMRWIPVLLGFASAMFLTIKSALRQDRICRKHYRYLPEYREYVEDTHILMPLMMSKPIQWD